MTLEKPSAKHFTFEVSSVDRERGRVSIVYGGQPFEWFLREDGRTLVLVTGDQRSLSLEALGAMRERAWAILRPALDLHNLKDLGAGGRAHDER